MNLWCSLPSQYREIGKSQVLGKILSQKKKNKIEMIEEAIDVDLFLHVHAQVNTNMYSHMQYIPPNTHTHNLATKPNKLLLTKRQF